MTQNHITGASLHGEISGHVQELRGFTRFHREPESCDPKAQRFIRSAGSDDIADRAGLLFDEIRKGFGYKRKEIAMICDDGAASIKTPDFDVTLELGQNPGAPASYLLSTEVSGFTRHEIVNTPCFAAVFGPHCDTVAMDFVNPVDIETKIDLIEENDALAELLHYDASCAWFVLRLPRLTIEVTPLRMTFKLSGQRDLSQLISETQAALGRLAGAGIVSGLPSGS